MYVCVYVRICDELSHILLEFVHIYYIANMTGLFALLSNKDNTFTASPISNCTYACVIFVHNTFIICVYIITCHYT